MTTTDAQQAALEARLERLKISFNLEAFTRRAMAQKLNNSWAFAMSREQQDRADRMDSMMDGYDWQLANRFLLTPLDRAHVRRALAMVPDNIRDDLDVQQYRLHTDVYRHLGADHRRRVAEARCWVIDSIDAIDRLDFHEARRLIVDAEHMLGALLSFTTEQERPSRRKAEIDVHLRDRMKRVAEALRRDAVALREVAA
jgi:hypothetical protein